ncbi:MAG: peptidylprolyl isomerase, partial [Bacteroidota bacterium]|nr:peptidylprolyl isomerase [Bacteroidota bacterium]
MKDFLGRYEDYLIWTGVQDNLQTRFAILNNMINEVLLRSYDDNSKVYSNTEYKKELSAAWKETVLAFLKDREVYAKIKVTDAELREAYIRTKIKLAVRHLYARTEKEAENLYKLVTMGVRFEELAKQVFTDTTLANNGGYLGYITWGDTDPSFEKAAYSLKVGEVSKPVKTAQGYSIIRVDDRIENPFTTEDGFQHQKQKLERALRIEKKAPYEEAYLAHVFDKSKVKFNEKAIAAVFDDLNRSNSKNSESKRNRQFFADCVKYKNRTYSEKEIENELFETPEYGRELLTSAKRVKDAVLGLIMQDVLLRIAHERGYDTTSYVKDTYAKLENDIYLRHKRDEILTTVPVSDSEIVEYYKEHISYYSTEKEINVQEIIVNNDSLAAALKMKIEHGNDFGTLAERYSLRKWSAVNKGMMGLAPL